jgi:Bacterial TniB protein
MRPGEGYQGSEYLQPETLRMLVTINVKMLIVDEIHHVLAGPLLKQRHFLNVIKYMGNELQIPIAAAGTHDAFNAIQIDPHSPIGSSRRSCHASR